MNIVLGVILLFVVVWVLIFGGIGALLSRARGGSGVTGLAWGVLLGPVGWVLVLWRTRHGRPGRIGGTLDGTVGHVLPAARTRKADGRFSFDDDPY